MTQKGGEIIRGILQPRKDIANNSLTASFVAKSGVLDLVPLFAGIYLSGDIIK